MKRLLRFSSLFLLVVMLFSVAACESKRHDEYVEYDELELREFIDNYDAPYDFDDDMVIVVLTDEASEYLDEYKAEDFSQVGAASIKKMEKNFIFITLAQPGRENVLRAVFILERRSDVMIAEPNFYYPVD